ncbi:MAG: hypothetical protein RQ930_00265 [Candidatus Aenigmarchaeota archaeon]|nr:hypothetical protein [Candidatus Aenigmarchaeota archaeon]
MNRQWLFVSIGLFLLIVAVVAFLSTRQPSSLQPYFIITSLSSKPTLLGTYIKNPDIIHSAAGFLSLSEGVSPNDLLPTSSDWKGTAFVGYSIRELGGRNGVAIIHPVTSTIGRYIEQETYLPSGKYKLVFGIANVADIFPPDVLQAGIGGFVGDCADVGIKVIVTDLEKGKDYIIFDKVIRNGRWYDYSVDLSSYFSNKRIKVRAESYAADKGCGLWNGEWAAVDYIDIQPY